MPNYHLKNLLHISGLHILWHKVKSKHQNGNRCWANWSCSALLLYPMFVIHPLCLCHCLLCWPNLTHWEGGWKNVMKAAGAGAETVLRQPLITTELLQSLCWQAALRKINGNENKDGERGIAGPQEKKTLYQKNNINNYKNRLQCSYCLNSDLPWYWIASSYRHELITKIISFVLVLCLISK